MATLHVWHLQHSLDAHASRAGDLLFGKLAERLDGVVCQEDDARLAFVVQPEVDRYRPGVRCRHRLEDSRGCCRLGRIERRGGCQWCRPCQVLLVGVDKGALCV